MKKYSAIALFIAGLFYAAGSFAQEAPRQTDPNPPRWHSDKGYWVIESNVKTPDQSVVRFYNTDRQLIYSEKITGVVLNCSKRKTLMKLKRVLEKVVDGQYTIGSGAQGKEVTAAFTSRKG